MATVIKYNKSWQVYKGIRDGELYSKTVKVFENYKDAKAYADEIEERYPGVIQRSTGRYISPEQWDIYCEQAHKDGTRYTARLHDVHEATLTRRLSKWRKARDLGGRR